MNYTSMICNTVYKFICGNAYWPVHIQWLLMRRFLCMLAVIENVCSRVSGVYASNVFAIFSCYLKHEKEQNGTWMVIFWYQICSVVKKRFSLILSMTINLFRTCFLCILMILMLIIAVSRQAWLMWPFSLHQRDFLLMKGILVDSTCV